MSLTTEKYYTHLWLPLRIAAFGLPLETTFQLIINNSALIETSLPGGTAVGMITGMAKGQEGKAGKKGA